MASLEMGSGSHLFLQETWAPPHGWGLRSQDPILTGADWPRIWLLGCSWANQILLFMNGIQGCYIGCAGTLERGNWGRLLGPCAWGETEPGLQRGLERENEREKGGVGRGQGRQGGSMNEYE